MNYAEIKKTFQDVQQRESVEGSSFLGFEAWLKECSNIQEVFELWNTIFQEGWGEDYPLGLAELAEKVSVEDIVEIALSLLSNADDAREVYWKIFFNHNYHDSVADAKAEALSKVAYAKFLEIVDNESDVYYFCTEILQTVDSHIDTCIEQLRPLLAKAEEIERRKKL